MIRHFHCTVSAELISQLQFCPPGHWSYGKKPKLNTFSLTGEDNKTPVKLKIRDREKPVAGEIYRAQIYFEPREKFIDEATGKECASLDQWRVRLYVPTTYQPASQGELRFNLFPLESSLWIRPEPVFKQAFTGEKQQGCLWIAAQGAYYRLEAQQYYDKVLFSGPVVVQVFGPEEKKAGSVAIKIGKDLSVYDRRADRLSSFARAEHIRRTCGRRTFEFVNLRDITMAELAEDAPAWVLTNDGFQPVED